MFHLDQLSRVNLKLKDWLHICVWILFTDVEQSSDESFLV
jgi:hypothetical protein